MPTAITEWDIFRPRYGGIRIECWVNGCGFHRDFEDTTKSREIIAIKKHLVIHLLAAHGIDMRMSKMRISE